MFSLKNDAFSLALGSIAQFQCLLLDQTLAFLNAEYRLLLIFVVIASGALFAISQAVDTTSIMIIPAFIIGAVFSALAGNVGMRIATEANARTAEAAKTSLPQALKVSFGGGTVMGLGVAGLAVLGLSL